MFGRGRRSGGRRGRDAGFGEFRSRYPALESLERRRLLDANHALIQVTSLNGDASHSVVVAPARDGLPNVTTLSLIASNGGDTTQIDINEKLFPASVDPPLDLTDPRTHVSVTPTHLGIAYGTNTFRLVDRFGNESAAFTIHVDAPFLPTQPNAVVTPAKPTVGVPFEIDFKDGPFSGIIDAQITLFVNNGGDSILNPVVQFENNALVKVSGTATKAGTYSVELRNNRNGGGQLYFFDVSNQLPTISNVSRAADSGDSTITFTLTGTNFVKGTSVLWAPTNGIATHSGPVSVNVAADGLTLTTTMAASDLIDNTTGFLYPSIDFVVKNPLPVDGKGLSNAWSFPLKEPTPSIQSESPAAVPAGSKNQSFNLFGVGFSAKSIVLWNGVPVPISPTLGPGGDLSAPLPDNLLTQVGTATVGVRSDDGQTSNTVTFTIGDPSQGTVTLQPASDAAVFSVLSPALTAANLHSASVLWNGQDVLQYLNFNPGKIDVAIPSALDHAGTAQVTLVIAGQSMLPATFTINNIPPNVGDATVTAGTDANIALSIFNPGLTNDGVKVLFEGHLFNTTVVNGNALVVDTIPAALIPTPTSATFSVPMQVFSPSPSKGPRTVNVFVKVPRPTVTSIDPSPVEVSEPGFTETGSPYQLSVHSSSAATNVFITGTGFVSGVTTLTGLPPDVTVQVNSDTELEVAIPGNDLAYTRGLGFQISNPLPDGSSGGSASGDITLETAPTIIENVSPSLLHVDPTAAFDLTITGENFYPAGSALPIVGLGGAFVNVPGGLQLVSASETQMVVHVSAGALTQSGMGTLTVYNLIGLDSDTVSLPILNALPVIQSVRIADPGAAIPQTLDIQAINVLPGATLMWNGGALQTTTSSFGDVMATRPAGLEAAPGAVTLVLVNGDGQPSAPFAYRSGTITAITPSSLPVQNGPATILVTARNATQNAVVVWQGQDRLATQYISTNAGLVTLQAQVPKADLDLFLAPQNFLGVPASINLDDGGNLSPLATVTLTAPYPIVASLSPNSVTAGSVVAGTLGVTIAGSRFLSDTTVVRYLDQPIPFAVVSDTQIVAQVPASLLAQPGTVDIFVKRQFEGVEIGNSATLTIVANAPHFLLSPTPPLISAGTPFSVMVTIQDQFGRTATGYRGTIHFDSTSAQRSLPLDYTFTGKDAGQATFPITLNSPGAQTITVSDPSNALPAVTSSAITVTVPTPPPAPSATRFVVTGVASSAQAGSAQTITVTAVDASGRTVSGYRGSVVITSSDPRASVPIRYTFMASDGGNASIPITLYSAGSQTILVADGGGSIPTVALTSTVVAGRLDHFAVSGFPNADIVNAAHTVTVVAVDAFGNRLSGYTGTVAITSSDKHASLPKVYKFLASDGGTHTFKVTLRTKGNHVLMAADKANPAFNGREAGIVVSAKKGHH